MHRILIILLLIIAAGPAAGAKKKYPGPKTYVYRYYLRDKQGCGFSLDRPSHFLSAKAIERRKRQRLKVDSTDLPVSRRYTELFRIANTEVLGTSRWNNTIVVRSRDSLLLRQLHVVFAVVPGPLYAIDLPFLFLVRRSGRPRRHSEECRRKRDRCFQEGKFPVHTETPVQKAIHKKSTRHSSTSLTQRT